MTITSNNMRNLDTGDRIGWLERRGDDFPYYNGLPVRMTTTQWWLLMAAVIIAFLVLILPPPFARGPISGYIPVLLYCGIPLAMLAYLVGPHWTALFRPLLRRDILLMIGFPILNVIVTFSLGLLVLKMTQTTANAAITGLSSESIGERALFFIRAIPQLLGEELMSVLPFLGLMAWLVGRCGVPRKSAILIATLVVALLFAAAHLPTYGWNIIQAVLGVGVARIILLLPYIMTKNVLVCAGAHLLNDWLFFAIAIFLGSGVKA